MGCHFLLQGDLLNPGIETISLASLAWAGRILHHESHLRSPTVFHFTLKPNSPFNNQSEGLSPFTTLLLHSPLVKAQWLPHLPAHQAAYPESAERLSLWKPPPFPTPHPRGSFHATPRLHRPPHLRCWEAEFCRQTRRQTDCIPASTTG